MKVLILAGGLGTRLRSVINDVPKPLAPINEIPYIAYILKALYQKGLTEVILSVGYKAQHFTDFIERHKQQLPDMEITLLVEPQPLGTGGALRYCYGKYPADSYLIFNGDSFCDFSLEKILSMGEQHGSALVVAEVQDVSRYGEVTVFPDGKVKAFHEKKESGEGGMINAGIYYIPSHFVAQCEAQKHFSLEHEIIPKLLESGLYAVKAIGEFIDIGVPEDYQAICADPAHFFENVPKWSQVQMESKVE
ncbi:MAG: D-glycero-alpha-D-manno-heptose 1-phosphate guanylyltransferase [Paraglaciecola sp.]|jgi:D-glycero-alpha-D-manno-heptose 1-phosphate guanylyltransferase